MSEWKEYKLGEIAEILDFKRIPLSSMERANKKGQYPYYGASGIIDYLDDYIFEGEHVLISEDGENLRSRQTPIAFLADGKFWVNNHAHIVKSDYIHNRLICYYFANLDLNPYITGAVQPKLSQNSLNRIPLFLPISLDDRKKIVSVLSSLDDKIDLLNRENATLEGMAETLFRQWFIEEAKEDWEEIELTELINIGSGKGLSHNDFCESGLYPVLGANGEIGRTNKCLVNDDEHIIYTGRVGTLGNIFRLENKKAWLSDNTLIIKPNKYYNYVYFILRSAHLQDFNVGSTQPLIRQSDIKEIEISLPDENILNIFETKCQTIYKKISNNKEQIHNLSKQRDILLPKLMSNEINIE